MGALRETLLDCLSAVHVQLTMKATSNPSKPAVQNNPPNPVTEPSVAVTSSAVSNNNGELPLEKDLRLALGLLLKHRGGPGFGHGRLQGKELAMMEDKLRSVVKRLGAEAVEDAVV